MAGGIRAMQKNLTIARSKARCIFFRPWWPKKPSARGSSWRLSEALSGGGDPGKEVNDSDDWEIVRDCNEDATLGFPPSWMLSAATSAPGDLLALAEEARWRCSSVNFKHLFACANTRAVVHGAHCFWQPAPAHWYLRAVPHGVHTSTVNMSRRPRRGRPTTWSLTSSSDSTSSVCTSTSTSAAIVSSASISLCF